MRVLSSAVCWWSVGYSETRERIGLLRGALAASTEVVKQCRKEAIENGVVHAFKEGIIEW